MEKFIAWMAARKKTFLISGPIALLIAATAVYIHNKNHISTDDAYVKAAKVSINANVAGQVIGLFVKDNQNVSAGQLLFRLDQRPYRIAIEKAQAELAKARLNVQQLKILYQQKTAELQEAKDNLSYATTELNRRKKMQSAGLSSQSELDKAQNTFKLAQQRCVAAKTQQANILNQLEGNVDISPDQIPSVKITLAALRQAKLNLAYTEIKAPQTGIVTKVENLQVGDYVRTGEPVFALISTHDVWVEANFKETQITHMRPGQKARISLDAYPDKIWSGHVESFTPGTGIVFSLLPPENATGNWVKIVQRVPIRIAFDEANLPEILIAGLSANVTVDTSDNKASQPHG